MSANPESETMIECLSVLVNGVAASNLGGISDDLRSHNLISQEVYDEVTEQSRTKSDKARTIIKNVTFKVNANPKEEFPKFLEVLRKHEELESVVKIVEEKFGKIHGDACIDDQPVDAKGTRKTEEFVLFSAAAGMQFVAPIKNTCEAIPMRITPAEVAPIQYFYKNSNKES